MASIQHYSEPSIEDAFAIRPLSKRNQPDRIPSFRRGADTASASISAKQTVSGTIHSFCLSVSSATASVHDSPSSLIPTASIKCTSIEEGFGMAPIPGDNEALILDSSIQRVVDGAPGSVSVDQTVAVKCHKNVSAIVGREGERQESNIDHGSMSWDYWDILDFALLDGWFSVVQHVQRVLQGATSSVISICYHCVPAAQTK